MNSVEFVLLEMMRNRNFWLWFLALGAIVDLMFWGLIVAVMVKYLIS